MKYHIPCQCGGGGEAIAKPGDTTAVTECACGRVLFWSGPAEAAPLAFNISDSAAAGDHFGG